MSLKLRKWIQGAFTESTTVIPLESSGGKMTVLPFKRFRQKNVPFRLDGKWYRRSNKFENYGVEVVLEVKDTGIHMSNANNFTGCASRIDKNPLIAVFTGLLTEQESHAKVAEINFNGDE